MGFEIGDFTTLMALEPHGPDVYVGVGPDYPWGRVYGGQVVAQGLCAASATVESKRPIHSLHAYFMLPGDPRTPIVYEVERIRDGRSFTIRRVKAIQHGRAIFATTVSYQVVEEGLTHQPAMPDSASILRRENASSWPWLSKS